MYDFICIDVFMYICIYDNICIYVYMYICIYAYMQICIYAYMHICIYVYMYMCIICIYDYIRVCVFMYVVSLWIPSCHPRLNQTELRIPRSRFHQVFPRTCYLAPNPHSGLCLQLSPQDQGGNRPMYP